MKIHIFQHAHFEDPGNIVEIASLRKHSIKFTRFYEDFTLPEIDEFDLLIIMGAPMSIHDEDKFPWLVDEKKFIKEAIDNKKKVLGICFGSQLIADVLGAPVYTNTYKEIGWFNIRKNLSNNSQFLSLFEDEVMAFHWHGDTYDIPKNGLPIFTSDATKNQGFTIGKDVVALQFHWELTKENVDTIVEYCGDELVSSKYIQTSDEMLSYSENFKFNKKMMELVFDYFE